MTRWRAVLVTVTDHSEGARADLEVLVRSLVDQGGDIALVLVIRGDPTPAPPSPSPAVAIHVVRQPLATSLSRARNAALAYARAHDLIAHADVVAFPDDDCRYPAGVLDRVARLMREPAVDVLCGSYAPSHDRLDTRRFPRRFGALTPARAMAASSNTMFFSPPAIAVVGDFDERLGLGARYASSEDVDYILRALRHGFAGLYRPEHAFVEHPYKPHHSTAYYEGIVAALAKHARGGGTLPLLIRRFALGGGLVLGGRLAATDFFAAIRATPYWLRQRPDPSRP